MSEAKTGTTFSGEVRDLASDGRGVVIHPSGKTVFVSGVWPGEKGTFQITGTKGRIAFGKINELEVSSSHRQPSPCAYQGTENNQCGGCPWMFMEYEAQLEAKQKRVSHGFSRLGLEEKVLPIAPSVSEFGYRNRAQLKTDGQHLGFVANQSNRIVAVDKCLVLNERNNTTLQELNDMLPNPQWRPAKKSQWTTLDIDDTVDANSASVNQRLPFMQGNPQQNQFMRGWLKQHLSGLSQENKVIELFCGSGNFTEVIAQRGFSEIVAVEAVEAAVKTLDEKTLPNVNVALINLYQETLFEKWIAKHREASILVLDPPREGLKVHKGLFHKKSKLEHIFYISCDLATLLRDTKLFLENGFHAVEVQPLDQFPQTPHIETCVYFKRLK